MFFKLSFSVPISVLLIIDLRLLHSYFLIVRVTDVLNPDFKINLLYNIKCLLVSVAGTSYEVIQSSQIDINWPYYMPNDTFSQCLAYARDAYWNLNILDCDDNLPFICQQCK